jgi:hypothetical protein
MGLCDIRRRKEYAALRWTSSKSLLVRLSSRCSVLTPFCCGASDKLIEIVGVGKQMLITRGALPTFSIANDLPKHITIIPAMYVVAVPSRAAINIMHLANPHRASCRR